MGLVVIGLTGAAGSGKSTVARHLVEEWGAERLPFAGPLKRMLRHLLEDQGVGLAVAHRMTDGDLKEVPCAWLGGATPRHAMQTLGTEWGRGLAPTFWVEAWARRVETEGLRASVDGETILVVADDVRFPEEVAAIRSFGGIIVRVTRPGAGLAGTAGRHASETTELGAPDLEIDNNRDLDTLMSEVDRLAANWME